MTKNGDEMAFPGQDASGHDTYGMTKREYMAVSAMQKMIADPHHLLAEAETADVAVAYADALLKRLEND